jgi:hypothetical protein
VRWVDEKPAAVVVVGVSEKTEKAWKAFSPNVENYHRSCHCCRLMIMYCDLLFTEYVTFFNLQKKSKQHF